MFDPVGSTSQRRCRTGAPRETDSDARTSRSNAKLDLRFAEAAIETGYTASSIRIFASSAGLERNGE